MTSLRALRAFDQVVALLKRQVTREEKPRAQPQRGRGGSAVSHCDAPNMTIEPLPLQPVQLHPNDTLTRNGSRTTHRQKVRLTPRTSRDDLDPERTVASPAHEFTSLQSTHDNGDALDDVTQQKWLALRVRGGAWRFPSLGKCFN